MASQLSANWTNTIILPDYDRIDILLNAEPGDDKCEWSVYDTGAFRHVVNDPERVVKGSIRPCNINVRGVFGGAGKAPKYMCDAIDVVKTQNGTAELLMQDAIMIETCPHPLVAGGRLAWGGFIATIAPRNRQSTLTSPGGDVIHLANRGILFIPRASVAEGQIVAVMTPAHSNTSLFLGFSGVTVAGRKNIAHWWKKLGGSRSDQFDKANDTRHEILRNECFAMLQRAFEKGLYDVAFFAPPCHTYSICRFRFMSGFPVLRTIHDIMGSTMTGDHLATVSAVNTIVERMCDLIMILHAKGKDWAIENPVQRSDATGPWKRYFSAKFNLHGSLWQMPCLVTLRRVTGAVVVNAPMCFFDPDGPQKYTTVLISKSLAPAASAMSRAGCSHDKHKQVAVGLAHSRASQVYSSPFCETWARIMRWPDDADACSAVLSHLALRAENATSAELPVVSAVVPVVPICPVEYGVYVDALQRDRVGTASETDRLTLSHARSRGVQTPGGIGRPDYRGMLQVQAADVLAFQPVELEPVDYQEYVDALQRHRAGAQMGYDECTLSHAVSRGVVTPGGICRPDSRGILHLIAAPPVVWNADARKVAVGFDSSTRDVVRTERRHKAPHRVSPDGPFLGDNHPPKQHIISKSPAPCVNTSLHATTGSRPDLGAVVAVTEQMAKGGLGIDESGVFTQLQRPGTRADGSSKSDFHVMRGSQGSAANTSSRRYHMRYHVGSDILRNLTRCSADAPEDLERMLDIPACDACLSGKTGRFGSEQHVPECTKPGEIICLDLWSTRVGCVYNGEKIMFGWLDVFSGYGDFIKIPSKTSVPKCIGMVLQYCESKGIKCARIHVDNEAIFHSPEAKAATGHTVCCTGHPCHVWFRVRASAERQDGEAISRHGDGGTSTEQCRRHILHAFHGRRE